MNSDAQLTKTKKIEQFVIDYLRKQAGSVARAKIIEAVLQGVEDSNYNGANATISSMWEKKIIEQKGYGLWGLPGEGPGAREAGERGKTDQPNGAESVTKELQESDFYQPFATWLVEDVGECTRASALGGKALGIKWGTPDVVGIYRVKDQGRYKRDQIISFVSAEIKVEKAAPVTAFGQACAYLGFSHKVYLVLPLTMNDEDKRRVESLSQIVGLGLVYFNPAEKENPRFEIRVRPVVREPDASALNEILKEDEIFNKLK